MTSPDVMQSVMEVLHKLGRLRGQQEAPCREEYAGVGLSPDECHISSQVNLRFLDLAFACVCSLLIGRCLLRPWLAGKILRNVCADFAAFLGGLCLSQGQTLLL